MRKIHFIGGLPHHGSTLLTNIIIKNPRFQSTATSSLLELLIQVHDNWEKLESHKAYPEGQDKWGIIRPFIKIITIQIKK
jgi:hypothetical protein